MKDYIITIFGQERWSEGTGTGCFSLSITDLPMIDDVVVYVDIDCCAIWGWHLSCISVWLYVYLV